MIYFNGIKMFKKTLKKNKNKNLKESCQNHQVRLIK